MATGTIEATPSNATADEMPGALNQGWDYYFRWAEKNHGAWASAFQTAEKNRVEENKRWREYFKKVYEDDMSFYKKVTMLALNGIQLWALWKQFQQQKEIADRTYEIADRQQQIAEELFAYYKKVYQPHETALSKQITDYFNGAECVDYNSTGDRFEANVRKAFAMAKDSFMRCTSSHCGGVTPAVFKQFEIEQAQAVGNARTGAYRYEEMFKETKDNAYLELRMKMIQVGRNISEQGQNGIMNAFNTFSSFGADPGAALNQLLGTLANTVGGIISSPTAPSGSINQVASPAALPYDLFMHRVMQGGDLQPAKAFKTGRYFGG